MLRRRSALLAAALCAALAVAPAPAGAATLRERAVLPAETFWPGPPSGTLLGTEPINGIFPPFAGQPVQGFSALLRAGSGQFWAMPDNGYGTKANSADFLLRVYLVRPSFERAAGGPGTVRVTGLVELSDPDRRVPWPIVNDATDRRLLTGADFDIESMRPDGAGGFWFGDEFGPFLLHTDARGRLLEAPVPLPGVKSPDNPTLGAGEAPRLPASRGFEGTALMPDGVTLLPTLEGPLAGDPDRRRRVIHEYRIGLGYTGRTWTYRAEHASHAVSDVTAVSATRLVVVERDASEGAQAAFKRVYLVDLARRRADGSVSKQLVADLLSIGDPARISLPARPGDIGLGNPFSFPFQTTESVLVLSPRRLLIANDNNFPFSTGRNPLLPDHTELITIELPRAL